MYRLNYLDEDLSEQECLSARDSASASVQPHIHILRMSYFGDNQINICVAR